MYQILVINLGSTSSKVAYYEDRECKLKENIVHKAEELRQFPEILDQQDYRRRAIEEFLARNGLDAAQMDAVVSRGGQTHPIPGGAYRITDEMLAEIQSGVYGRHATDIGVHIAAAMAKDSGALGMVVDPPVTDEFEPLARYSGLPELPRISSFHALNQRAVARKYAEDIGAAYEQLNLVCVHMGGGISVVAHRKGRMVDGNNALTGDGPFSTNRTGTLPAGALVELCFSGKYTKAEVMAKINGKGGLMAYLGENDVKAVEKRAMQGDDRYKECLDAMLYQTGKEIGGAVAVLNGEADAILLTGGIAHSSYVVEYLTGMIGGLAPVKIYPGEHEMEALALGAYSVLTGSMECKTI